MKKIVFCLMALAAVMMTGCTKEKDTLVAGVVRYDYSSVDSVKCVFGHSAYAAHFLTAMSDAMSKYNGKENIDEKQLIADMRAVVNQYDNHYLMGSFDLKKILAGKSTVLATFTMRTQTAYYVYDCESITGREAALAEFKKHVAEAVSLLDEMEEQSKLTKTIVEAAMKEIHEKFNQTNISGNLVVTRVNGSSSETIATYTFVPQPIYRVYNFNSDHVNWVKGLEHCSSNPFRVHIRQAKNDTEAIEKMDSVLNIINKTCYYSKKDSVFTLRKSMDGGETYTDMKNYTIERADYIIGMDSVGLISPTYTTAARHMYDNMQDSMEYFMKQGMLYDKANLERIETSMRNTIKGYMMIYKDMTGTIKLFGLKKDDSVETLATIDLSRLDDK